MCIRDSLRLAAEGLLFHKLLSKRSLLLIAVGAVAILIQMSAAAGAEAGRRRSRLLSGLEGSRPLGRSRRSHGCHRSSGLGGLGTVQLRHGEQVGVGAALVLVFQLAVDGDDVLDVYKRQILTGAVALFTMDCSSSPVVTVIGYSASLS